MAKQLGSAEKSTSGKTIWVRLAREVDPARKRLDLRDLIGAEMSADMDIALEQGKDIANRLSLEALRKRIDPPKPPAAAKDTFEAYAARHRDHRAATRAVEDPTDDYRRLRTHAFPILGKLAMTAITRVEIENVVERLDKLIASDDISWKTAANVWSAVRTIFWDACHAKAREMRVLTNDPTADVAPPERGEKKQKPWLYPDEFLTLVTAPAIWEAEGERQAARASARRWMRLFTLAAYLGLRAGELRALEWSSVDLEHWIITIHKAARHHTAGKQVKKPKGKVARFYEIEPAVRPLLLVMHAEAGGKGRVIAVPPECDLSPRLRKYLGWARIERAELFADDAERAPLTFHDLRATWITWRALREDGPFQIQRAAGHKSLDTTQLYIRTADDVRRVAGTPFPTVPELVVGRALTAAERRRLGDSKLSDSRSPVEKRELPAGNPSGRHIEEGAIEVGQKSALAHGWPTSGPQIRKTAKSQKLLATPTGLERNRGGKTPGVLGKNGPVGPRNDRKRPQPDAVSGPVDPVLKALEGALLAAIAAGDRHAAGQLAAELAGRATAPGGKVVPLRRRGT